MKITERIKTFTLSFNPCFIGLASATLFWDSLTFFVYRFNPCFIGLASATAWRAAKNDIGFWVSILVLLD